MRLLLGVWAFLILFLTQGDGSGSGEEDPSVDKVAENAKRMLDRHQNNAVAAIAFMMGENARDRKGQSEAKAEVVRLQTQINEGKLLTKEQGALYDAYVAMGTPDQLKTIITERDNFKAQTTKTAREKLLDEVAEIEGLRVVPLSKLARRDDGTDVEFIVREVDEDGQKRKRGFVKEGDKETPLMDYAETNWSDFTESLRADSQGGGSSGDRRSGRDNATSGLFPGQGRGEQPRGKGQGQSAAQQVINARYKRPGAKPAS